MPAINHIHKYQRLSSRRWRCTDPYCTHTISREEVVGKASLCGCGTEFILDYEALRRRTPKCINCSNTKEAIAHRRAQELIKSILTESEGSETNGDNLDS